MDSDKSDNSLDKYIHYAYTDLEKAKISDTDEILIKRVRLPVAIIQCVSDICHNTGRNSRNIKTGMILHGFYILRSVLNENDTLNSFRAHDDIYRYFKDGWNYKGGVCKLKPALLKKHVTYNMESIDEVRERYGFSMSASKCMEMEKTFKLLKLHLIDGYTVCVFLSLKNMNGEYSKYTYGDINYLNATSDYIIQEIKECGRDCKQWVSDCRLFDLHLYIKNIIAKYGEVYDPHDVEVYHGHVLNLIEGCKKTGEHMTRLGLYNMSEGIQQIADEVIHEFNNMEQMRVSLSNEEVYVPGSYKKGFTVTVDEDVEYNNAFDKSDFEMNHNSQFIKNDKTVDMLKDQLKKVRNELDATKYELTEAESKLDENPIEYNNDKTDLTERINLWLKKIFKL